MLNKNLFFIIFILLSICCNLSFTQSTINFISTSTLTTSITPLTTSSSSSPSTSTTIINTNSNTLSNSNSQTVASSTSTSTSSTTNIQFTTSSSSTTTSNTNSITGLSSTSSGGSSTSTGSTIGFPITTVTTTSNWDPTPTTAIWSTGLLSTLITLIAKTTETPAPPTSSVSMTLSSTTRGTTPPTITASTTTVGIRTTISSSSGISSMPTTTTTNIKPNITTATGTATATATTGGNNTASSNSTTLTVPWEDSSWFTSNSISKTSIQSIRIQMLIYVLSNNNNKNNINNTSNNNNRLFVNFNNNNNNNNNITKNASFISCNNVNIKSYSTGSSSQHHQHQHNEKSCWKCKKSVLAREFFCPLCNVVQTPQQRFNVFEVFSLEPSYRVDQKDLSHRFKQLQKKLHPDLFQQSTETEQSLSKDQSTLINSAYNILKSPFLRAEFILNEKGYDLNGVSDVDPEVLSEILEVREEIEETDNEDKLKEIAHDNRAKMNHCEEELVNLFQKQNYKDALGKTIYLRYLTRIQEEIHKRLGIHI
ncbi:hypothetical protein PPL_03328 [Heterostelium album PN500]|uniref:J domain-containing protein n=1 Tax=Heterostelium pallidum (strain ATCC 26659 / Pp 5 / PN500) TaxID=670386 RepID=D3B4K3_HETP5|nr:hypothetical protein PPL_03328 [Heterostelium album PN500]EFA84251.1 hypothetical protein PPL_03328 [Heterostelium album PN500]|eukprot:XP_020436367.1 hypothetical protein PPL_03328 [Heterostelium album PN500]